MPPIDNYFSFLFLLQDAEDDEVELAEMDKRPNNFSYTVVLRSREDLNAHHLTISSDARLLVGVLWVFFGNGATACGYY